MTSPAKFHTYLRSESVVFKRNADEFGGLSNMATGYPLVVAGVKIQTVEALYQACRFPHQQDAQRILIRQKSPMAVKMVSRRYIRDSRLDWDEVRLKVMRWCLRVKLAQHWTKFGDLLASTEGRSIVEESSRDTFWGAKPMGDNELIGQNFLGRLLLEVRRELLGPNRESLRVVEPPNVDGFLLLGQPINRVTSTDRTFIEQANEDNDLRASQFSLFDRRG